MPSRPPSVSPLSVPHSTPVGYSYRFTSSEAAADAARTQAEKDAENQLSDDQDEDSDVLSLADDESESESDAESVSESDESDHSADPIVFVDTNGETTAPTNAESPHAAKADKKSKKVHSSVRPPLSSSDRSRLDRMIIKYIRRVREIIIRKIQKRIKSLKKLGEGESKTCEDLQSDYKVGQKLNIPGVAALAWRYHWDRQNQIISEAELSAASYTPLQQQLIVSILQHQIICERFDHIERMAQKKHERQQRKAPKKLMQKEKVKLKKEKKQLEEQTIRQLVGEKIKEKLAVKGERTPENYEEIVKPKQADKIRVGKIIQGVVRKVEEFGLFVEFWHKLFPRAEPILMNGFCHISQCADERIEDLKRRFAVGDRIRACVYRIDQPKKRGLMSMHLPPEEPKLQLTMKSRYFPSTEAPTVEKSMMAGAAAHAESKFVGSLKQDGGVKDERLATVEKFMAVSNGQRTGKNRLGQRERRKLSEAIYGDKAMHKKDEKENKKRKREDNEERNGERNSFGRDSSQNREKKREKHSREEGKPKQPQQQTSEAEQLHPSWAAKKEQKLAKPEGKKVKLDD